MTPANIITIKKLAFEESLRDLIEFGQVVLISETIATTLSETDLKELINLLDEKFHNDQRSRT